MNDRLKTAGLELSRERFTEGQHALIIGAGLAGCAAANVLARRGLHCTLFDSLSTPAQSTSGVPAAIYRPPLSRATIRDQFLANGYSCLLQELTRLKIKRLASGLLQRADYTGQNNLNEYWQQLPPLQASAVSQSVLKGKWLYTSDAGAINPTELCNHWLAELPLDFRAATRVESIHRQQSQMCARDKNGKALWRGDFIVLANANGLTNFTTDVPLDAVRGQLSRFRTAINGPVLCDRLSIIPTAKGMWTGATYQRGSTDLTYRAEDDQKNRHHCSGFYEIEKQAVDSWVGIRCTTPDRMPVIGSLPESENYRQTYKDLHIGRQTQQFPSAPTRSGVYAFAGLGSNGLVQALYGAQCLAEIICGGGNIEPDILRAVHPARFLMRQLRRAPRNR